MRARATHRFIGLVMLLPFLGWAVTGAIFFIKPGYGGAYEALSVKMYPLTHALASAPDPSWLEIRELRTVLGDHLLVRTGQGWQQVDPVSRQQRAAPTKEEITALVTDAITINPSRYGKVVRVDGSVATTDTGARVTLSWSRLSLAQRGKDTDRIDAIYRIHYLQWTGIAAIDRVVGAVGLTLIVVLCALGVKLVRRRP